MELFQLLGTIAIDNDNANKGIDETTSKASKSKSSMVSNFAKIGKAAIALGVIVTTALTKSAVTAFADYEQLVGGVETLFKDSSEKVLSYANDAYTSAGLSSNKYMETITSFSASLLQGLGGDTDKAAEIGNMAIIDMSDNANKMGSSIETIQNAYQGFAKQNYTMLDNLKLGYGGTQSEMVRLINDSGVLKEKISSMEGVSFDTMISAIHEVQNNMGITGTTALEASTTIQGSLSSIKSAWENLMVGIADGNMNLDQLFNNLWESVKTVAANMMPRIQESIKSIFTLASSIVPEIARYIMDGIPKIAKVGAELMGKLGEGFKNNLPSFITTALNGLLSLSSKLRENAPVLIDAGLDMILNLGKGLADSFPVMIATIPTIVSNIAGIINDNAPKLLSTAGKLIMTLGKGLISAIPTLVANIPKIIKSIIDVFIAFQWLSLGKSFITAIKNGFVGENPVVVNAAKKILNSIVNGIKQLPAKLFSIAKNGIGKLVNVLKDTGTLKTVATKISLAIVNSVKSLPSKMLDIGKNLVQGLWNGISNMKDWVIGKIQGFGENVLTGIKDFFGIHSPSKVLEDEVGKNLVLGLGNGITKFSGVATSAAIKLGNSVLSATKDTINASSINVADTIDTSTVAGSNAGDINYSNNNPSTSSLSVISVLQEILESIKSLEVDIKWNERELGRVINRYG